MLRSRLLGTIALLGLVVPMYAHASPIHGGRGETVVLRFHFVAGQRLLYRATITSHVTTKTTGGVKLSAAFRSIQAHISGLNITFLVRVHVIQVAASGVATLVESIPSGKGISRPRGSTITIAPDGRQQVIGPTPRIILAPPLSTYLPYQPVRPGSHWTITMVRRPKREPAGTTISQRIVVSLRLVGFGLAGGEPVAVIQGSEHSRFHVVLVSSDSGGVYLDEQDEATLLTERTVFGLSSGNLVSRQVQSVTVNLYRFQQPGAPLFTQLIRIAARTDMQRLIS